MNAVEVVNLRTAYDRNVVHDDISFRVRKGEIFSILGSSGSGKTTLLQSIIMLNRPVSGKIFLLDQDIWSAPVRKRKEIISKFGVVFQFGALFTSLNVMQNVTAVLDAYSNYPKKLHDSMAMFWLSNVGIGWEVYGKYPSELSGGMKKRVALARALCTEPEILFLDEPTSGLDPASACKFDKLIINLRNEFGVTVVMITHDLDSIKDTTDRFILLGDRKIQFEGSLEEFSRKVERGLYQDSLFNSSRGKRFLNTDLQGNNY